jgi:ABC-2 type transport system permease protein
MHETVIRAPAPSLPTGQPSAIRLGLSRAAIETRMFFRERDAVIFTFSFPIILLVIFGSIFADDLEGTGLNVSQLYVAGLIGSAAMTGFQNLGITIAGDRDDGTLKRLRGTPLPPGS